MNMDYSVSTKSQNKQQIHITMAESRSNLCLLPLEGGKKQNLLELRQEQMSHVLWQKSWVHTLWKKL